MFTKIKSSKVKVFLIFLASVFVGSLVYSSLRILDYKGRIKKDEVKIIQIIDNEIDFEIEKIFLKFTQYRNDEFIKSKDFTMAISSRRENDKRKAEEDIQYTKEDINEKKQQLRENNENLSKEKIAEEIKKLDEKQQEEIEKINNRPKKTDEEYKEDALEQEFNIKKSIEKEIEKVGSFNYLITDNKNGEYDTNSTYGKTNIEEKFFRDSKYAVKFASQDKSAVILKEYVDGKSAETSDYILSNTKKNVKENDVTLYLWVPINGISDREIKDRYLKGLIEEDQNNKKMYTRHQDVAIASLALLSITLVALLWLRKKKIELKCDIYNKIPHDLLTIALLGISFIYILESGLFFIGGMFWGYNFQKLNPFILIGGGSILGTILVTYIKFIKKKPIKEFWKNGVLVNSIKNAKSLLEVKDILFKIALVFGIIIIEIVFVGNSYFIFRKMWPIVPVIFIIVDGALFVLLAKKLIYFNNILEGTEKITKGDLTLVLEEKGKGNLGKLSHNINNMKIGLKNSLEKEMKSERMKSELITNVSHDLKTPLTSIINYVDLLKKEKLTPDKANDYVEILDRKSKRLKTLVEDLFEASKAASGSMELNIENIEITELIKQTLAEFEEKILSSTLDFRVNLGKEKVYAMVDGKRTYRVFENLVQNVLKYSMKNSRVYIDLIQEEGTIKFTIKNMSSYEMNFNAEEIAERFKRGDVARTTEGSGLGLAIAKSIMELQGGELKLQVDGDLFKAVVIFKE